MTTRNLVIVGASLAGAKAAEAAREAGFDGRLLLIGEEPAAPYERPPLSKAILRGDKEPDAARVHPDGFYGNQVIELVTERATRLDLDARTVELASGGSVPFDSAVLATGAIPRHLEVPGAGLAGIHYLRTIDDAVRLGDAIRTGSRVAVIGAGWIGSEVAASARQMGAPVVLIDAARSPLQRVVGDEIGAVFGQLHADNGVDLRLGTGVVELRGTKTVDAVVLDDGSVEPADVVVIGIGVTPRTELADAAAGLRVDNGIVVDEHLQSDVDGVSPPATSPTWHRHYGRNVRVEHWANALHQGTTAGRNAIGERDAYRRLPYFFSDQYDLGMEYVGRAASDDTVAIRGDTTAREFIAFWHHDGVVSAAMNVNVWDVVEDLEAVIEWRRPVDPARLSDPAVPLSSLVS